MDHSLDSLERRADSCCQKKQRGQVVIQGLSDIFIQTGFDDTVTGVDFALQSRNISILFAQLVFE
jgi:hypothetical protein